jgi:hypothetical protein
VFPLRYLLTGSCGGILLAACASDNGHWYSDLEPTGPCYRVELANGLDEAATEETQDLFRCLNKQGHFRALEPVALGLEGTSDAGVPAGVEFARTWNALSRSDLDLTGLVDGALGLATLEGQAGSHLQDLALELMYGTNAIYVRRDSFNLQDPAALRAGAVVPLRPALGPTFRAVLDDDLRAPAILADILEDPETPRWIWTMEGWVRAPGLQAPLDDLLPAVGEAILSTRTPENDRWSQATGDSLRDLVDKARQGNPDVVERISPELLAVLNDRKVRANLPDLLVGLQADGHLQVTPPQAGWLAMVDVQGGTLAPGEDSALTALLRLLDATNRPMACSINLGFTSLDVDFGNLAVTLLTVLADQNPDDVQGYAAIVGDVFGYGLGEGVIVTIAETGVCPTFTPQVARDLQSLDRLGEPQARGLTHTLIGLVRVLRDGDEDHVGDLVQVVSDTRAAGLVPPLEEVLRDTSDSDLTEAVVALVPAMDRPARYNITARDAQPATLEDLLGLVVWVVEPGEGGETGWQRLKPVLLPALEHDGTWEAAGVAGRVLADRDSALARAHRLIPPIVEADPSLSLVTELAPILRDRTATAPALRLASTEAVLEPLLTAEVPEGQEQPLAMAARLIRTGALDDLWNLARTVVREIQ